MSYNLSMTLQRKDIRTTVDSLLKISNSIDFNLYSQKDVELQQERVKMTQKHFSPLY